MTSARLQSPRTELPLPFTTVSAPSAICSSIVAKSITKCSANKSYRVCPTLLESMCKFPDSIPVILDDYGIRRITPYECLALQGFPNDYKFAPKTPLDKAYKRCGNSVVVPVIKRIAEQIASIICDN